MVTVLLLFVQELSYDTFEVDGARPFAGCKLAPSVMVFEKAVPS